MEARSDCQSGNQHVYNVRRDARRSRAESTQRLKHMSSRARLILALVLVAAVAAIEFWGGVRAGSLALLTDAVHVCMDVFALGIAIFALVGAQRPATHQKTFGYGRVEILGALLNGSVLLAATAFIAYEAVHRFFVPHHPQGALMSLFAAIGLFVNAAVGMLLVR